MCLTSKATPGFFKWYETNDPLQYALFHRLSTISQVARRDIFCEFASRRSLLNKAAVTNGCRWMQETWSASPNGKPRTLGFINYKSNLLFELDARDFCKGGLGKAFPSDAECCKLTTFPFFTVGPPWMLPYHLPISRSFFFAAVTMSSAAHPRQKSTRSLSKRWLPKSLRPTSERGKHCPLRFLCPTSQIPQFATYHK